VGDAVLVGRGLRHRYATRAGVVTAVDGVDVRVERDTITAVAGPSGSGKSTLARLLACAERPDEGEVVLGIEPMRGATASRRRAVRRRYVSVLVAEPTGNLLTALDAAGNLRAMARWRKVDVDVERSLAEVGLDGRGDAAIAHLSGGEQQRLALAVAAVGNPVVLVADEPTAELDIAAGALVSDLLAAMAARGTAVLVATHDPALIDVAGRVLRLDHGRVVE
jgi:putative ABC transport system ATP-binding protein